jgi:hypothetical protein
LSEKVGMRVAVVSADRKTFLGFGTYVGDFQHPQLTEEYAQAAESLPDIPDEHRAEMAARIRAGETHFGKNPKLQLDNGQIAWGCETWWGPADTFIANGYAKKYGVEVASA